MILRKLKWSLALHLVLLTLTTSTENSRSYDTNEWIPITPSTEEAKELPAKRATGRVLNLDPPSQQKFFPDDDLHYRKRRPHPQHFSGQKNRFNGPKYENQYEFGLSPLPQKGPQNLQYFPQQEVRIPGPSFGNPPPPHHGNRHVPHPRPAVPSVRDRAPSPNAPSIYEQYNNVNLVQNANPATNANFAQSSNLASSINLAQNTNLPHNYTLPVYQTLGPVSINQELIGAIQNNPVELGTPQVTKQQNPQQVPQQVVTVAKNIEKEQVQLVYVPLETLNQNQPISQGSQNIFRQTDVYNQQLVSEPGKQHRLEGIQNDFLAQALQAHKLQQQIQLGQPLQIQSTTTTTTTPKPAKKRKPHQPPLAVYLENQDNGNIDNVLEALKDAKTIAVQDTIAPDSPQIFIGPSSLTVPEGYSRYPLPYLNSLEGNKVEKKIEHLPFFVAPLSFKTPPGYSKISLPSPHVGSIVISVKDPNNDKRSAPKIRINQTKQKPAQETYFTTSKPSLQDSLLQSSIDSQDYFNHGHSFSSQPNYLQYNLNNNLRQTTSASPYIPQDIFGNRRIPEYNTLPLRPQGYDFTNSNFNEYEFSPIAKDQGKVETVQKSPSESSNIRYNQQSSGENYNESPKQNTRRPQESSRENLGSTGRIRTPSTQRTPSQQYSQDTSNVPRRTPQRTRYTSTPNLDSRERYEATTERAPSRSTSAPTIGETASVTNQFYAENTQKQQNPIHQNISPLELAINEFELHQINTQLDSKPKNEFPTEELLGELKPSILQTTEPQVQTDRPTHVRNHHEHLQNKQKESSQYQYQNLNSGEQYISQFPSTAADIINSFPSTLPQYDSRYTNPTLAVQQTQPNQKDTSEYQTQTENTVAGSDYQLSNRYKNPNDFNNQLEEQMKLEDKDSSTSQSNSAETESKDSYPGFDPQLHRFANTPASILRDTGVESKVTTVPTPKSRRRGRPTRPTTTTTKETPRDKYTVLEEYSARQTTTPKYVQTVHNQESNSAEKFQASINSEPSSTPRYSSSEETKAQEFDRTEVHVTPANVYSLNQNPSGPDREQEFKSQTPQQHFTQQVRNHEVSHNQFGLTPTEFPPQQVNNFFTASQPTPNSREHSIEPLIHNRGRRPQPVEPSSAFENERNNQEVNQYREETIQNNEEINQYTHNRGRRPEPVEPLRGYNKVEITQNRQEVNNFNQGVIQNSQEVNEYTQGVPQFGSPRDKYNQGENQFIQDVNEQQQGYGINESDEMSEIIRNLQDPSIRTLLVPQLLAPTTKNANKYQPALETTREYITTTRRTTTTTPRPTEYTSTTTTTRNRGRQRGSSRFSQSNTTTRRSVARRRPTHSSRTTTERPASTTEYQRSTKQRFRTRGRTTPNAISERISTTENEVYNGPTSEAVLEIRKSSPVEFENVVNHKQIRPEEEHNQEYHRVFAPIQQDVPQVVQYENTVPASSNTGAFVQFNNLENENIDVNPPTIQESKKSYLVPTTTTTENEETTRHNFRVRGRGRTRTRPTSTTERVTTRRILPSTTAAPRRVASQNNEEEEEGEFYGFIRQPNFKTPTNQIQIASATQQPQYYTNANEAIEEKNNYLTNRPKDFKISYENTNFETTTVRFVGEIKPRYPSTTPSSREALTEATKPSRRTRIRTNPKKSYESNSLKNRSPHNNENQDTVTRRTSTTRTRGRSHYKPPVGNQRSKSDEEADIEGGNYPISFLQQRQSTTSAAPSFQITIDPAEEQDEDDQAPNSSIYRPTVVKPDEWHEATGDIDDLEAVAPNNDLQLTDATDPPEFFTTNEPIALAVKSEQPIGTDTQQKDENLASSSNDKQGPKEDNNENQEETTEKVSSNSDEMFRENTQAMEKLFEEANNFENHEGTKKKPKGRRRGVWKLVKQRPLDRIEESESQNYFSVLNMFDEIKKDGKSKGIQKEISGMTYEQFKNFNPILEQNSDSYDYESRKVTKEEPAETTENPKDDFTDDEEWNTDGTTRSEEFDTTTRTERPTETPITTTTTKPDSIFDSLYSMFDFSSNKKTENSGQEIKQDTVVPTTTLLNPTFPDEITEGPYSTGTHLTEPSPETTTIQEVTSTIPPEQPKKSYAVEPWEMREVRTSTSTEVSHETEICYKGKCIKSKKGKIKS